MEMSYCILKDTYLREKLYVGILEMIYTSEFEKAYEIIRNWSEQNIKLMTICSASRKK